MIDVAILGAGIGREHLAAFRALKDSFAVRAVVDQDLARVEDIRQDGDSFRALKDIDQALADPQVQVVDICLPPHLHASVTQRDRKSTRLNSSHRSLSRMPSSA